MLLTLKSTCTLLGVMQLTKLTKLDDSHILTSGSTTVGCIVFNLEREVFKLQHIAQNYRKILRFWIALTTWFPG